MSLFYNETRNKQLRFVRNDKIDVAPMFSMSREGRTKERISPSVSASPSRLFRFTALVTDLVSINLILFFLLQIPRIAGHADNQPLLVTANLAWIVSSYFTALYFGKERFVARTIQAYFLHIALTLLLIFLFKSSFSRFFVLFNFLCFGVTLIVSRTIFVGASFYIQNSIPASKFIVLGCNELSHRLVSNLEIHNKSCRMEGFFDDYHPKRPRHTYYPVLGNLHEALDYAIENEVTEIYSTIPPESNPDIYEIAQHAERNFIRFRFVPDFSVFINRRVHISFLDDLPVLSLRQEPLEDLGSRFKKRVFDIVFSSLVILFLLSWLIPIIAILIKLDSRGPVFFKQLRSGKNNMPFVCFKFRSLKVNNDADRKQVTRDDDRYTRIGRFLRKTNLDELPQFFNVFQGYMSIVGPRPHMLAHTEQYSKLISQYMIRHYVKPGITGLAQVNGYRGEITKDDDLMKRIEFDIRYMENWSMMLDVQVILKTIYVSVKGDENAF